MKPKPQRNKPCWVAARLALLGALKANAEHQRPTELEPPDWARLLADLSPEEVLVVAFHGIRGMSFRELGEWLGLSRGWPDIVWRKALAKMKAAAEEII